jgi:hypothetical protein
MADFDDFHLDRSGQVPSGPGRPDHSVALLVGGLVVIVLVIVAGGYVWWTRRPPATTSTAAPVAAQPAPAAPQPVAAEPVTLPPLEQTDGLVRRLVGQLSSHPLIAKWLATDQLIRNFTVIVTNIANGRSPAVHLKELRPTGRFVVAMDDAGPYIDAQSYHRYDMYADAIAGLQPEGTARVYETLKPAIDDAYRELGYPSGDFDDALKRAIVLLLKTPVVEGRIGVVGAASLYAFTDERLESLTGAQRHLLRMGPANERLVQDKLRAIAPLVGIAPGDLPPSRTIHESQ